MLERIKRAFTGDHDHGHDHDRHDEPQPQGVDRRGTGDENAEHPPTVAGSVCRKARFPTDKRHCSGPIGLDRLGYMETTSLTDVLRDAPLTAGLGGSERRRLASFARLLSFDRDAALLREGEPTPYLAVITSGRVAHLGADGWRRMARAA